MSDNFKFSQEGLTTIHRNLVAKTDEFKSSIDKLTTLVKEIESSASWKDATVKSSFVNSINSYVNYFNSSYTKLTGFSDYLNKKTSSISQFEDSYSKG